MSDENKCFSRPKVRFSRSTESTTGMETIGAFGKPKIRSIVKVKPSIKIVKASLASSAEQTNLRYSMGDGPNDLRLCPLKTWSHSAPCSTEIILTPENSSAKVKNLSDRGETSKSGVKTGKNNCLGKKEESCPSEKSKNKEKSKEASAGCAISRTKLSENRLGKENIDEARRQQSDEGTKVSWKCEISEKKSEKNVASKVKSKTVSIGSMPCTKFTRDRSKSAPAKKTILSDATARVYVGPGIVKPRPLRSRSEILLGDKLARPEYNSIVNTMKKLRDAREERIAEDLEHLPAVYRRLVNGKVSSALDFGANEAIYRDLVDLTIDEKHLPSRLTRSKDPEPRQRDLVPKLSDFFVPRNDEEYRRTVFARPPSPRVLDTFNPYKVSDRIFSWKECLDY